MKKLINKNNPEAFTVITEKVYQSELCQREHGCRDHNNDAVDYVCLSCLSNYSICGKYLL